MFYISGSKISIDSRVKLKSTHSKSSEIAVTNLNIPQALNYGQHIHRSIPPELALEKGEGEGLRHIGCEAIKSRMVGSIGRGDYSKCHSSNHIFLV